MATKKLLELATNYANRAFPNPELQFIFVPFKNLLIQTDPEPSDQDIIAAINRLIETLSQEKKKPFGKEYSEALSYCESLLSKSVNILTKAQAKIGSEILRLAIQCNKFLSYKSKLLLFSKETISSDSTIIEHAHIVLKGLKDRFFEEKQEINNLYQFLANAYTHLFNEIINSPQAISSSQCQLYIPAIICIRNILKVIAFPEAIEFAKKIYFEVATPFDLMLEFKRARKKLEIKTIINNFVRKNLDQFFQEALKGTTPIFQQAITFIASLTPDQLSLIEIQQFINSQKVTNISDDAIISSVKLLVSALGNNLSSLSFSKKKLLLLSQQLFKDIQTPPLSTIINAASEVPSTSKQSNITNSGILILPEPIFLQIFANCDLKTLADLFSVCKQFNSLLKNKDMIHYSLGPNSLRNYNNKFFSKLLPERAKHFALLEQKDRTYLVLASDQSFRIYSLVHSNKPLASFDMKDKITCIATQGNKLAVATEAFICVYETAKEISNEHKIELQLQKIILIHTELCNIYLLTNGSVACIKKETLSLDPSKTHYMLDSTHLLKKLIPVKKAQVLLGGSQYHQSKYQSHKIATYEHPPSHFHLVTYEHTYTLDCASNKLSVTHFNAIAYAVKDELMVYLKDQQLFVIKIEFDKTTTSQIPYENKIPILLITILDNNHIALSLKNNTIEIRTIAEGTLISTIKTKAKLEFLAADRAGQIITIDEKGDIKAFYFEALQKEELTYTSGEAASMRLN